MVWLQVSVQLFSCVRLWPHGLQHTRPPCASPTSEFTQTHVHWVADAIQPSHALSSPSLPTSNLSQHQGLFQWVSSSHQVAKVLEFQLQHQSCSNEYSGLISFRMDWLDLLAVQGTLKGLLQHKFKNINSLAFSFLYGTNLISIHEWVSEWGKSHSHVWLFATPWTVAYQAPLSMGFSRQ